MMLSMYTAIDIESTFTWIYLLLRYDYIFQPLVLKNLNINILFLKSLKISFTLRSTRTSLFKTYKSMV